MRILISNDSPSAHYYIRMGLARVLTAAGHEVIMWDISRKSVFDAFDEFNPDIFIGQTYNINDAIIKCIRERPLMKVIMKAADWGPLEKTIDKEKYPVLFASEQEKANTQELQDLTGKPDYLYVHYHKDYLGSTHGNWKELGFRVESMLNGADIFEYTRGQYNEAFASDMTFVGGYWGYKARVLDKWLLPLCEKDYNIKLFGNSSWPVSQYCGFAEGRIVNDIMASATICLNLHEPHSQDLGYDVVERPFKLLANKCFVISDEVAAMYKIFSNDELVMAKNPDDFRVKIDYYLKNPEKRLEYIERGYRTVMENHTYFERVYDIFSRLNLMDEANNILATKRKVFEQLEL